MELELKRIAKKENYTIGKLYIDGEYFCDTLEDKDRGLHDRMFDAFILDIKKKGETAIPIGKYEVLMNVESPKYKYNRKYEFTQGLLPRLNKVKGFSGILIHIGNYPKDTEGCILVGKNTVKGAVVESTETFKALYSKMRMASDLGEKITIEIE